MQSHEVEIVEATEDNDYEKLFYSCFVLPSRKHRRRQEYLKVALPKGLRKKVLLWKGEPVGMIEYAPVEAAGYPIRGKNIVVMNCIWVLRKAKGHRFGTLLMQKMMEDAEDAAGFATIGLEDHWSPWFKVDQLGKLGFRSVDSFRVSHKTKHKGEPFKLHLMWLPMKDDAPLPTWDKQKLLEGVYWCMAHPLYHSQTYKPKKILETL
jgi:GNAT superfamily N-acetyltransferase